MHINPQHVHLIIMHLILFNFFNIFLLIFLKPYLLRRCKTSYPTFYNFTITNLNEYICVIYYIEEKNNLAPPSSRSHISACDLGILRVDLSFCLIFLIYFYSFFWHQIFGEDVKYIESNHCARDIRNNSKSRMCSVSKVILHLSQLYIISLYFSLCYPLSPPGAVY